jgi:mono/diheme cytochrome c family protein
MNVRAPALAAPLLLLLTILLAAPASAQARRRAPAPGPDPTSLTVTDEDGQPTTLPALPTGMTEATLRQGDAIYRGKGGCVSCHGANATGVPGRGSTLTAGLNYIPKPYPWAALDSLERVGISEQISRTRIACPAHGPHHDLTDAEVARVTAYVWAVAHVRGEPWLGGHATHGAVTRRTSAGH